MSADQRETIAVLFDGLDVDTPTLYGVARLAIRSELPLVDVGMAVGALGPGIAKNQTGMALGTCHVRVHTAQGILCLVMVEFRNIADRLPRSKRVTVLAGHI